jgi:hypothetical protein
VFTKVDRRQQCKADRNAAYLHWKWRPKGIRVRKMLNIRMIVNVYGSRILFVGESLQRNLFEGFVDLLFSSVPGIQMIEKKWIPSVPSVGPYTVGSLPGWLPHIAMEKTLLLEDPSKNILYLAYFRTNSPLVYGWNESFFTTSEVGAWTQYLSISSESHPQKFVEIDTVVLQNGIYATNALAPSIVMSRLKNLGFIGNVIWIGTPQDHFVAGKFNTGGHCNFSLPLLNYKVENSSRFLINYDTAKAIDDLRDEKITFIDIHSMTVSRPDAHPGLDAGGKFQDCLHWCIPGVPTWWSIAAFSKAMVEDL